MAALTVRDIIEATGGESLSETGPVLQGVSIDTRTIQPGDIFIALRGERFDGHTFLGDALQKGSGAVVERPGENIPQGKVIICVKDTLRSLQDLARFLRMKRDIPVVAVTGSNGKTTTKEMISSILSRKYKVLKNEGNLNNHIGLPLSLMKLAADDEVVVLEMGMNAPGEIHRLCEIAAPSHGVITNVGTAHVGRLGSYEAVRDAKLELLDHVGLAVINADDAGLMKGVREIRGFSGKIVTFAVDRDADVRAADIRSTEQGTGFALQRKNGENIPVLLNVHGIFNVSNAIAAAAVCFSLGIAIEDVKAALESYRPVSMRFEVVRRSGITIINDAYNANPTSMESALRELLRFRAGGRLVAVLGDMKELEEFSEEAHRNTGRLIMELGVDAFVAVGDMMGYAAREVSRLGGGKGAPEIFAFRNINEAAKHLAHICKKGDTVLVKGSRAMAMEKIIEGVS